MAAQGYSREELREEVARVFGYKTGTTTGAGVAGGTTAVDATLAVYENDYFINWRLFVGYAPLGHTYSAPDALITDYVGASGTLTFTPAHTDAGVAAAVPTACPYELYKDAGPTAINHALGYVCRGTLAMDALTPSATTVDYDLSALTNLHSPDQIRAILRWPAAQHTAPPQELQGWQVWDDDGVLTLSLPTTLSTADTLSIAYRRDGDPFSTDATVVNLPMPLVRARAVVYLIENKLAEQDGQGLQRWGTMLREWKTTLLQEERKHQPAAGRTQRYQWARAHTQDPLLSAFGLVERYR